MKQKQFWRHNDQQFYKFGKRINVQIQDHWIPGRRQRNITRQTFVEWQLTVMKDRDSVTTSLNCWKKKLSTQNSTSTKIFCKNKSEIKTSSEKWKKGVHVPGGDPPQHLLSKKRKMKVKRITDQQMITTKNVKWSSSGRSEMTTNGNSDLQDEKISTRSVKLWVCTTRYFKINFFKNIQQFKAKIITL